MRGNNSTGILIIAGILLFAIIQAFGIKMNMENIKLISIAIVVVVMAMFIFSSIHGKKGDDSSYTPDKDFKINPQNKQGQSQSHNQADGSNYHNPNNPFATYQNPHATYSNPHATYNNPYATPIAPTAPPVAAPYNNAPEEDNRWS